ncbi:hypothetical protein C8Q79DRAFT_918365 [Trametes meyenii]|nr:hypothetical protein C8Q79DRAFT_918365 [Trametes meyenii]
MPPRKKARIENHTQRVTRSSVRLTQAATASAEPFSEPLASNSPPRGPGDNGTSGESDRPSAPTTGGVVVCTGNIPSKKVIRIRRGTLQQLPEMPIEIQDMIFRELNPRDMLNLTRTCKRLRQHFLNRENERLWKAALQNAPDLPTRPPWLCLPAFVHLLYSQYCHNCGAPNVRRIQFGAFMRLCSTCIQERSVWFDDALDVQDEQRHLWPFDGFDHNEMYEYMPVLEWSKSTRSKKKNRLLKEDVALFIKGCKESLKAEDPYKAFAKIIAQIEENYTARVPYARAIEQWMDAQEHDRQSDLDIARQERFQLILKRLRASGWNEELAFMGENGIEEMSELSVVRQSSKLTPGAWNKVVAVLNVFLNQVRKERLDAELRSALRLRMAALTEAIASHYVSTPRTVAMDCRPLAIDFAYIPEIRGILDLPTSQAVAAIDFASALQTVGPRWDAQLREVLTDYLRPHLGNIADGVDPLSLAIAVFEHQNCDSSTGEPCSMCMLRYPTMLLHSCGHSFFRKRHPTQEELYREDLYTRAVMTHDWDDNFLSAVKEGRIPPQVHVPFQIGQVLPINPSGEPVARMRKIVIALGLDPERTTYDELQACDRVLYCVSCENTCREGRSVAFGWNAAVRYTLAYKAREGAHDIAFDGLYSWRLVTEEDVIEKVRARRDSKAHRVQLGRSPWSCTLCPTFVGNEDTMPQHLVKEHDVHDLKQAIRDEVIYPFPQGQGQNERSLRGHTKVRVVLKRGTVPEDQEAQDRRPY